MPLYQHFVKKDNVGMSTQSGGNAANSCSTGDTAPVSLWRVFKIGHSGEREFLEGGLPQIIAADMVDDYRREGTECVMERERIETPRDDGAKDERPA